jgi:hypothetical protein
VSCSCVVVVCSCRVCCFQRPGTPVVHKYTRSLFRAVSHTFTIGYGMVAPTHIGETAVVTASMLTGFIIHMLWVGTLVDFVSSIDSSGAAYDEVVSKKIVVDSSTFYVCMPTCGVIL